MREEKDKTKALKKRGENEADIYQMLMAVEEENHKLKGEKKKLEEIIKQYDEIIKDKEGEMSDLKYDFNESGNLAEFTIRINGVLEAAENAAQEYIESNRKLQEKGKTDAKVIVDDALKQKEDIINEAKAEARSIRKLNLLLLQNLREEANKIIDEIKEEKELEANEDSTKEDGESKIAM